MSNYVYEDAPIKITFTWTTLGRDTHFGGYEQNGELVATVYTYAYKNSLEDAVNPILPNTPIGKGRYVFDYYADPYGTDYDTEEQLATALFTTDTEFTAHFRYRNPNPSGGGGGN